MLACRAAIVHQTALLEFPDITILESLLEHRVRRCIRDIILLTADAFAAAKQANLCADLSALTQESYV